MAADNPSCKAEGRPSFPEAAAAKVESREEAPNRSRAVEKSAALVRPSTVNVEASKAPSRPTPEVPGVSGVAKAGGKEGPLGEQGDVDAVKGSEAGERSGEGEEVEEGEGEGQSSGESDRGGQGCKAVDSEVSDDGTGILAPHTKVVVIGNNRTKPDMVGLRGCIKKSVGLGGWHFIRLTSGEEVKLQRNALSVVELPTGNEPDFTDEEEHTLSARTSVSSSRKRRVKVVGGGELTRRVAGKRSVSEEVKPKRETYVDFNKLDIGNLRKYRRHYRLSEVPSNSSKDQLVSAVTRHFRMQTVDEGMVMSRFYRAIQKHSEKVA